MTKRTPSKRSTGFHRRMWAVRTLSGLRVFGNRTAARVFMMCRQCESPGDSEYVRMFQVDVAEVVKK